MNAWPREFEDTLRLHLPALDGNEIDPDAPLTNYGLDSMTLVALMMELEIQFDFGFPPERVTPETFYCARVLWTTVSSCTSGFPRSEQSAAP